METVEEWGVRTVAQVYDAPDEAAAREHLAALEIRGVSPELVSRAVTYGPWVTAGT